MKRPVASCVFVALCFVLAGGLSPAVGVARPPSSPVLPAVASVASLQGQRTLAVVLINFGDDRATPWTPEQIRARVAGELNSFYPLVSSGKLSFNVSGYGWYQLAATSAGCDYRTWADEAQQQAQAAGVDLASFDHVMLVFPRTSACDWEGLGDVPGRFTWINGGDSPLSSLGFVHEIGHNLGLSHASGLVCPGASLAASGCYVFDHIDHFDAMGDTLREFSSWHKAQLGWLEPSEQQTVTASGDYSLTADEAASSSGVKLILIPISNGDAYGDAYTSYALELRQQQGPFDSSLDAAATHGVLIRLVPSFSSSIAPVLVDGNPSLPDQPAFQSGQSLVDSLNNVTITTLSAGDGHALVHIQIGDGSPSPNLRLRGTATPRVQLGGLVSETVTVSAAGHAAHSVVLRGDSLPTPVSVTSSQGDCTTTAGLRCTIGDLAPGEQATIHLTLRASIAGPMQTSFTVTTSNGIISAAGTTLVLNTLVVSGAPPQPLVSVYPPRLLGAARVGAMLRASSGNWLGAASAVLTWLRCDSKGSHCHRILAAGNARSYRLVTTDRGMRIRVAVVATAVNPKLGPATLRRISEATRVVR